jgi:hypothetical protein
VSREPGTRCSLRVEWWDGPLPVEGDFLRTPAGSCYRIVEFVRARPGSKSLGRLICERLERDAVQVGEPGVFKWTFAVRSRARRPA